MNYPFIKLIPFIFSLLFALQPSAQNTVLKKYTLSNKGKFFISWGGNRESYSKSNITFKGKDYRFTIKDISAHDKPKGWHIDYINPTRITIPQTNIKLGYFISDHYSLSIGVDHMKYVMNRNKTKTLNGFINLPDNEAGSEYNGVYNNDSFFVSEEFLKFEHTNGLNYIYSEIARYDDILSILNIHNIDKIQINITEGVAAGVLYPKSNTTLLSKDRYDEFHLAGYGLSANVGLNLTFCKHFYVQTDLKGGYINMNDIRTTSDTAESASQHFWFLQRVVSLGGIFRI